MVVQPTCFACPPTHVFQSTPLDSLRMCLVCGEPRQRCTAMIVLDIFLQECESVQMYFVCVCVRLATQKLQCGENVGSNGDIFVEILQYLVDRSIARSLDCSLARSLD